MKKFDIQGAVISSGIALLTGLLSGYLSGNQGEVYKALKLPPLSPPSWLFGVVWPLLYILMGIAAYLIYISSAGPQKIKKALLSYALQLAVNFSWSIIFFRFQAYGLALAVLALLILLVTIMFIFFFDINKTAALLIVPYYIWLLYAYYLNAGVFILNYNQTA